MTQSLTLQEQTLIRLTQAGLPLHPRPYKILAEQLNISENDVIDSFFKMKSSGLIRRVAITPNHYALGYQYNLMTVWDISDADVEQVGKKIAAVKFVSHCYQRPRKLPEWPFNCFAMIHAKSQIDAEKKVQILKKQLKGKYRQFSSLKSSKILKKTGLRI